jgi:hypothetical protein
MKVQMLPLIRANRQQRQPIVGAAGLCQGESLSHNGLGAPERNHDWPSMKIEKQKLI